jgi:hypothetical protein
MTALIDDCGRLHSSTLKSLINAVCAPETQPRPRSGALPTKAPRLPHFANSTVRSKAHLSTDSGKICAEAHHPGSLAAWVTIPA